MVLTIHRPDRKESGGQAEFPMVGIGASAGGLDAFKQFFSAMPADSGMAFVLVQHLDPTHESLAAELLATSTPMQVVQVEDRMPVEANHVYVIPPNRYLTISAGVLHLSEPTVRRGMRLPIDFFFQSLAEDQGDRGVGIVLSGTGSDGTLGARAIKGHGGMVIAQNPETASYDGMPRAAIATGMIDYVLAIQDMPEVLIKYIRGAWVSGSSELEPPDEGITDHLDKILTLLRAQSKHDWRCYKKNMLMRRIQRRMHLNHLKSMADYLCVLRENRAEIQQLFQDLLIGVTGFFRDPEAFEALKEQVIAKLVQEKDPDAQFRVWVPSCATGEEAYSIAMLLIEQLQPVPRHCKIQIFATDINEKALEFARAGTYPESIAADLAPEYLRQFFHPHDQSYRVNKQLREAVVFASQDLISDPPFSKLDLISCRNLLIYLEPEIQRKIISLFHFALSEGGYLFLGNSETVGQQDDLFEPVSTQWRIYRRLASVRPYEIAFPMTSSLDDPRVIRSGTQRVKPRPVNLRDLTQQVLLRDYTPAAVLINCRHEILYLHGLTGRYLDLPAGEPTRDLMSMARAGLHARLRTAVHRALQGGQQVTVTDARVKRGETYYPVKVTVRPVQEPQAAEGLLLVTFEEIPEPATALVGDTIPSEVDESLIRQLEYELKTTRENLRSTIEDLEAANEELTSTHEEAVSRNEELQSSSEELEASKEELQSLNEELNVFNSQLQNKVEELETAHNDLANLFSSTAIATIFLDTQLRIKRFTPAITQLFSLISADVGRPIHDFAHKFNDGNLLDDTQTVLATRMPIEREVYTADEHWYIQRILPYQTLDNRISGVVITFVDITARYQAEKAMQEARRYAEDIVATVHESLVVLDKDLRVVSANRAFYRSFQITPQETENRPIYELGTCQWDISGLRRLLENSLVKNKELYDYELTYEVPIIGHRTLLLNARRIEREDSKAGLILLAIADITERKRADMALRASQERYQALYDNNPSMYFTVDTQGMVLSVNRYGVEQLGYTAEELIGTPLLVIHSDEDKPTLQEQLKACLQQPDQLCRWQARMARKDGVLLWVRESARLVQGVEGTPMILIVCEDITEAHQLAERISYQAGHDALTNLVNRRDFESRLIQVLETTKIQQTEHALCYLDLDQFKVINDSHGHLAGDELLRQLSDVLKGQVRVRDTVARLGGDEFGILLEHCPLEQAWRLADSLRKAVEDFRFLWNDQVLSVGVSIGLVPITMSSGDMTDVLKAADAACYIAKEAGRNHIHVYHEQDSNLARRHTEMQWVARLQQALEENRFHLYYQPILPVQRGADGNIHYELLIRMQDETGELVLPGVFLPAAERYNLATKLDRWVIQAALDWLTTHPEHLEHLSFCTINLSGHSLGDAFLDFVRGRLAESQLPAQKICFEITETAAIANLISATQVIKALKELGCRFALDDFGSGLSSFAYLQALPVDFLKIDGRFVKDIVANPIDLALVKSINEIGHIMGKKTIAEWVENDAILDKLRELGVDYAQGYSIGRPQPLEEMPFASS